MTYRERREARAERLRGWAEQRTARATAQLSSQPELRHDYAFITQPGRIPARERMNAADDRAFASLGKAEAMASRADEIERQAANAIYSDDPDAADALRAKIARLEAERDRWTAYNASAKRAAKTGGLGDLALLDERQRAAIADLVRIGPPFIRPGNAAPPFQLSNLGANISRLRKRLEAVQR